MNKKLINKDVLNDIIANSNICQHAIKELKLAGYGKGEGGPNDWIYQQVLELLLFLLLMVILVVLLLGKLILLKNFVVGILFLLLLLKTMNFN